LISVAANDYEKQVLLVWAITIEGWSTLSWLLQETKQVWGFEQPDTSVCIRRIVRYGTAEVIDSARLFPWWWFLTFSKLNYLFVDLRSAGGKKGRWNILDKGSVFRTKKWEMTDVISVGGNSERSFCDDIPDNDNNDSINQDISNADQAKKNTP
jgi:hypothetical protein